MSKGFEIEILDKKGSTPFHLASFSGSYNAISYLISCGTDINK